MSVATAVTREAIEAALRQALQPISIEVQDDSHLHAGHAGDALIGGDHDAIEEKHDLRALAQYGDRHDDAEGHDSFEK